MSSPSGEKSTKLLITAAVAIGGLGVAVLLLARSSAGCGGNGSYKRHLKNGALNFPAASDPHMATQVALYAIRDRSVRSVGGLVYLLRGSPEMTFDGKQLCNAYRVRVPMGLVQFLQESYLPATLTQQAGEGSPILPIERPMLLQLVACDMALRRLERERATPFDNESRVHTNLLQQLWVASGKPLSSYARMGPQWLELGFQGNDPATDLRGAGVLGLRQLVHFAQRHPQALRQMVEYNKRIQEAKKDSWYLIAVVSFQFTAQLLLQRDHKFTLAHLQVLYDSLTATGSVADAPPPLATTTATATATSTAASAASSSAQQGGSVARSTSREARVAEVSDKTQTASALAAVKVWTDGEYVSDAEAGLFLLHEKLLLHFKAYWEADEPHVMSYNTYLAQTVFAKFFSNSWSSMEKQK